MSRRAWSLVSATGTALSIVAGGCTVDQGAEVAAYREIIDLGETAPLAADEELSLERAVRLTNDTNEELSLAGESYLQALIERQRSSAALMPTVDLFGALTMRENVGGGDSDDNQTFDGGLGAQYTLMTGMTDVRLVEAAQLTSEQRYWALLDLRESLLLQTVRAYYVVLLSERQVSVLESSLTVQEERLRDIRGRREVGFARPLDVAQIEAQTSETRVLLIDAQNLVQVARAALSLLTGVDVGTRRLSDGFTPPPTLAEAETATDLLGQAMVHRRDIAAAAAGASAARQEVDAEIGRYYPTVTVNLDYFLLRDTTPSDREWLALLGVNLPIFSAGRIDADVRDAWSRFRQSVLLHSLTRRQVQRDVEVAWADLEATRARVLETRTQVQAAEEAIRQAEAAYAAGLGTNLERITAQDQALSAQLRAAREEYNEKVAYLAAMRSAGLLTAALTGEPLQHERMPPVREAPSSPFVVLPGSAPGTTEREEADDATTR